MNDKIFELQQDLIKTQDGFKEAIMSESDSKKHADIIAKFSKEEEKLSEKIENEIKKENDKDFSKKMGEAQKEITKIIQDADALIQKQADELIKKSMKKQLK